MIDVRRAGSRFHTRLSWLDSWHSFSFGGHHDPSNVGHGLLVVSNDDVVAPGGGFDTHPHRDMEIVTWVLEGALEHRDSAGHHGVIVPGLAQRMSAGRGIRHSEINADPDAPVHLIQMWVLPDEPGIEPSYEQADVGAALSSGELVTVAAGPDGGGAVTIHQRDARLRAGRLAPGTTAAVADVPHAHLFVARGKVRLESGTILGPGDAARLSESGPVLFTALDDAEVLLWETA